MAHYISTSRCKERRENPLIVRCFQRTLVDSERFGFLWLEVCCPNGLSTTEALGSIAEPQFHRPHPNTPVCAHRSPELDDRELRNSRRTCLKVAFPSARKQHLQC